MNNPIPPLPGPVLLVFLVQVAVLLGLAVVLGRLAVRLGMPQVIGELCAGLLLGPSLLGHVAPAVSAWLFPARQFAILDGVGQVGMLLLVGVTGMYLDVGLLRRQGLRVGVSSGLGLVVPLGLGIACGFVLPDAVLDGPGNRAVFALFLGIALCVSALPVVAKILTELGFLHRDVGQLTIIAAGVDDVIGWLLLSIVTAMATTGVRAGTIATSAAVLVGIVLAAAFLLRPAVKRVLGRLAAREEPGPTIAVLAVLIIGCAAATQALKMEALLGAFLVGIVISSTGAVHPRRLATLQTIVLNVLAPIFFATAGLRMNLTLLGRPAVAICAVAVILVAVISKFAGAYLGAKLVGLDRWRALALGAGLTARGVVQIVVASIGLRAGVLNAAGYTTIVLVAISTSAMAPPLLRLALNRIDTTPAEQERERAASAAMA